MTTQDRISAFKEARQIGLSLSCVKHRKKFLKMILDSDPLMEIFSSEELKKKKTVFSQDKEKQEWTLTEIGENILKRKGGDRRSKDDVANLLVKIKYLAESEIEGEYRGGNNLKPEHLIGDISSSFSDPIFTWIGCEAIKFEISNLMERKSELDVERQKLADKKANEKNGIFEVIDSKK